MKRYGIPLLVIVVLATAAYAWRTSVAKREFIRHQRKAHVDSLSQYSPTRTFARTASDETPTPPTDLAKSLTISSGLPDSIRPEDFSESKHPFTLKDFEKSEEEDGVDMDGESVRFPYPDDTNFDTLANLAIARRGYLRGVFIRETVMAVLLRHFKNPDDAEEFGRCPSGYFKSVEFVKADTGERWHAHVDSLGWRYGNIYFGEGCEDTLIAKYRINYEKRWVEMKDPNTPQYVSLRTYEVMKFGKTIAATLAKKD